MLTDEQKDLIGNKAATETYSDILENGNTARLWSVIREWVKTLSLEQKLDAISSDESVQREELGFDPVTGVVLPDLDQDYNSMDDEGNDDES